MLIVVGLGPGSEEFLTLKAVEELKNADVVLTPSRLLNIVHKYARKAEILKLDPKRVNEQILELYREYEHCRIVIASTGDPLFSGIGKNVISLGLPCTIVPGISSIQVACARIRTSWDNMVFLSLHEKYHRNCYEDFIRNAKYFKTKIGILTSPNYDPSLVLKSMSNILHNYRHYVCENLTLNNERVIEIIEIDNQRNLDLYDFDWNSIIVSIPRNVSMRELLYKPSLCTSFTV